MPFGGGRAGDPGGRRVTTEATRGWKIDLQQLRPRLGAAVASPGDDCGGRGGEGEHAVGVRPSAGQRGGRAGPRPVRPAPSPSRRSGRAGRRRRRGSERSMVSPTTNDPVMMAVPSNEPAITSRASTGRRVALPRRQPPDQQRAYEDDDERDREDCEEDPGHRSTVATGVTSSATIEPSRIRIIRWACAPTPGSWVTRIEGESVTVELVHEHHHLAGAFGVERAGGLVGPHDPRPSGERARDRDPLLLAARQLVGAVRNARRAPRARASRRARRRASRGFSPARSSGTSTFSTAVSTGMRLNCWKTKPIVDARSRGAFGVAELMESTARRATPDRRRSRRDPIGSSGASSCPTPTVP